MTVTADARKVSPLGFLDALALSSPEKREAQRQRDIESCIRAIHRGDTYGYPPVLVAECKRIIAERETLAPVHRDTDPETGNERAAA